MAKDKSADSIASQARLATLRETLGVDALIVSSPPNTQYLSGCLILTQRLLPDRLALVVSGSGGEAFVVCDIEERQARADSRIEDIRGYTEFVVSPMAVGASVLEEFDAASGAVGFEARHLTAHFYEELRRLVPRAQLIAIDESLSRLRAIKNSSEIQLLSRSFQATDRAIGTAYGEATAEASTSLIADRMKQGLLENGADEVAFMVIGGGNSTLQGHPEPDANPLKPGDPLRVDFGGSFHGYHTDLARSAFFRQATQKHCDVYQRLWLALEQMIESVRPGLEARQVYALGKKAMTDNGLTPKETNGVWELPHVGHGIGLALHEFPMLEPSETALLEPGMVLCLELMHTEPGSYRLHMEDAVVVTEGGAEIVSRARDWSEPPVLAEHEES